MSADYKSSDKDGDRASDAERSKAERVYQNLRRRIRELELPPGAPLRKEEIALALGVSRAPVSEAIARLASEALVDVFPQHGSFVAPIRAEDVRDALFIRTSLEIEAARRAARIADPAFIEQLDDNLARQRRALKAKDLVQFYELDEPLHAAIIGVVDAPRATLVLGAARAPLDRPMRLALPEPGRPEGTLAEHQRIVDAIRTQDPEYAAAAMRAHLAKVGRTIERVLAQTSQLEQGGTQLS